MLRIIGAQNYISELKKRSFSGYLQKQDVVANIIKEVTERGDEALYQYARDFDGVSDPDFRLKVSDEEMGKGIAALDPEIKAIIEEAHYNITYYHRVEKEEGWHINRDGAFLGQLVNPIDKVGAYVPGGEGIYPSTALMNCVPAQIAGVPELYITTPPGKDGKVSPAVLYAAHLCGVNGIYKAGGAGAIAALAYGTETVPKVYKIVGPANLYGTTAKKMVYGDVDIDMIAGPSEIMILADRESNVEYMTFDLFSQSEHSTDASSIVLVPDRDMADKVIRSVEERVPQSKREPILREALSTNGVVVLYSSLEEAYDVINEYAPEHLEILIDLDFTEVSRHIRHVGSIFMGEYTPEPVGDYFAGSNHSLPTGGTAKFFSPLGVYDFQRRTSVIRYPKELLARDQAKIVKFAELEGFYEHANSARVRKV